MEVISSFLSMLWRFMTPETIGRKESTSYSEQKTEALGESCHKGTELFIIVAMVVFFFFLEED